MGDDLMALDEMAAARSRDFPVLSNDTVAKRTLDSLGDLGSPVNSFDVHAYRTMDDLGSMDDQRAMLDERTSRTQDELGPIRTMDSLGDFGSPVDHIGAIATMDSLGSLGEYGEDVGLPMLAQMHAQQTRREQVFAAVGPSPLVISPQLPAQPS